MAGMPKRGTPTTYPAPPFDLTASGLIGLSPSMPVPCNNETFSSSVISLTTQDARSSGERLEFVQGLALPPDCAQDGARTMLRIIVRVKNRFSREGPCRGIVFPRMKSYCQIVNVTPFCRS